MFCEQCGHMLYQSASFCSACGQKTQGNTSTTECVVDNTTPGSSSTTECRVENKCQPAKSYENFLRSYEMKEFDRQKHFNKKRKLGNSSKAEPFKNVKITIGKMDKLLRHVRGTKITIALCKTSDAATILATAVAKFSAHNQNFNSLAHWILRYPDGKPVLYLPEGGGLFRLDAYKDQLMKDYQRISFFIGPIECADDSDDSVESYASQFGETSNAIENKPSTSYDRIPSTYHVSPRVQQLLSEIPGVVQQPVLGARTTGRHSNGLPFSSDLPSALPDGDVLLGNGELFIQAMSEQTAEPRTWLLQLYNHLFMARKMHTYTVLRQATRGSSHGGHSTEDCDLNIGWTFLKLW